MSAPAPVREVASRAQTQGWRIALGMLTLAVAAPWFVFGLLLMVVFTSPEANPYIGSVGVETAKDNHTLTLIGVAVLVFAAILVPVPLAAAWRARRLRTVAAACAASAALSASPVIAFVILLATSDTPFFELGG